MTMEHAQHLPEELCRRLGPLQDTPSLRDPRRIPDGGWNILRELIS